MAASETCSRFVPTKIFGGTILPRGGSEGPRRELPEGAAKRQSVNAWIRSAGAFDSVIDFEQAVEDPARPGYQRAELVSGDKTAFKENIAILEDLWHDPDPTGAKKGFKNMVGLTVTMIRKEFKKRHG